MTRQEVGYQLEKSCCDGCSGKKVSREKHSKQRSISVAGRGNKDASQVSDLATSGSWYHSQKRTCRMKGKMKGFCLREIKCKRLLSYPRGDVS